MKLIETVETLQNLLITHATGGFVDNEDYKNLREELMNHPSIKANLPRFVITCRDLSQFWSFIKSKFSHYEERRQFVWAEFLPLIERLERTSVSPVANSVVGVLEKYDAEHVQAVWLRALDRKGNDPEGAITSARTLLESVCRHILEDLGVDCPTDADLPKLYSLTSENLNLAPNQHTEKIFKQILGSCQQIVEGLGALRNKLGDAHGKGKVPIKPAARHAELAVNLSGAMATFLIGTYESRKNKS